MKQYNVLDMILGAIVEFLTSGMLQYAHLMRCEATCDDLVFITFYHI